MALADELSAHRLDVGHAVETVLRSRAFFASENIRSRVVGPVEFVIGACRALVPAPAMPSTLLLADWTARLGQELFEPPNVGGWPGGRAWLTPRSLVGRANFAAALVEGRPVGLPGPLDARLDRRRARAWEVGAEQSGKAASALLLGIAARDVRDAATRRQARGRTQGPGDVTRLARGPDRLIEYEDGPRYLRELSTMNPTTRRDFFRTLPFDFARPDRSRFHRQPRPGRDRRTRWADPRRDPA